MLLPQALGKYNERVSKSPMYRYNHRLVKQQTTPEINPHLNKNSVAYTREQHQAGNLNQINTPHKLLIGCVLCREEHICNAITNRKQLKSRNS